MRIGLGFGALLAATAILCGAAHARFPVDRAVKFEQEFVANPRGGQFSLGESDRVTTSFITGSGKVAAEFQIREAHRTEEFGSGIALIVSNADASELIRVGFGDVEGDEYLNFYMMRIRSVGDEEESEGVGQYRLSVAANAIGSIELELTDDGRLIARSDGVELEAELGFAPRHLVAQVYCAKGWFRFLEDDLIS